jgi:hypothetical protein
MKVKKAEKERVESAAVADQMPPLPSLNTAPAPASNTIVEAESRSRSESIRDKTKILNDQINEVYT